MIKFVIRMVIVLLIAFCVSSPLKVFYKVSQGDYKTAYNQMREEKASPPYKPSNKSYPTYHLNEKGEMYSNMLLKRKWLVSTFNSFYGVYGYMTVWHTFRVYLIAGVVLVLGISITAYHCIFRWNTIEYSMQWIMMLSPLLFVINLGASIYHSMYVDFQAQGRYLFCTLIPFCMLLTGTICIERRQIRWVRLGMFIILYAMAITNLYFVAPLARPLF